MFFKCKYKIDYLALTLYRNTHLAISTNKTFTRDHATTIQMRDSGIGAMSKRFRKNGMVIVANKIASAMAIEMFSFLLEKGL